MTYNITSRLTCIALVLILSSCAQLPALNGVMNLTSFPHLWDKEKMQQQDDNIKKQQTAVNQFLAGLTTDEIDSMKDEAWRNYGLHWKGVALRSRYVRQPLLETLDQYGYPRELQMVPVVESSYDPYAHSPVGAAGLWQLMPMTASDLGIKSTAYVDGRRDIRLSTRGAAKYLNKQYHRFGNWPMALAAYHLGPNALQRRLNRRPWQPEQGLKSMPLPPITKTYIRHILGLIALHEAGKLSFPTPFPTTTLHVQTPIDLNALEAQAKLPKNQIFQFNPELALQQYVGTAPLQLRISSRRVAAVQAHIPTTPYKYMSITVGRGEHLSKVSKRYNTSVRTLLAHNPGTAMRPAIAQTLRLPIALAQKIVAQDNPMIKVIAKQRLLADNSGTQAWP